MSSGDPGWIQPRAIILQSHFPDRFLEAEGKVWQQCHEDENGVLVFVRMGADESERGAV